MIVWLNGPLGVGKAQVAAELKARLPGSFVADPAELGLALRNMAPPPLRLEEFHQHPLWRPFVLDALTELAGRTSEPLIVPMMLADPAHHRQIVGGLRKAGLTVHHFTLLASAETLQRRLRGRASAVSAQQLADSLQGWQAPQFAERISVDALSTAEVAETLARHLDLQLAPRRSGLQTAVARLSGSVLAQRR